MRVAKSKGITAHDAQQVARFRAELGLMVKLEGEGHSRNCARRQVFGELPTCSCLMATIEPAPKRKAKR